MELKTQTTNIVLSENILDQAFEVSFEIDFLLPDYNPSIFKVLKSIVIPKIYGTRISGNKLIVDGVAIVKVIYCAEESGKLVGLEQKLPFSKTIDLKATADGGEISSKATLDYVNTRVINSRRIGGNGALSLHISVDVPTEQEIVVGAEGDGVKIKKNLFDFGDKKRGGVKQFSIHEELELSGEGAEAVIYEFAVISAGTVKILGGKMIAKADMTLHIIYLEDVTGEIKTADFGIPVSQIVDVSGVSEDYSGAVMFDVTGVSTEIKNTEDGAAKILSAGIDITANAKAFSTSSTDGIADIFSTEYDLAVESKVVKTDKPLGFITASESFKTEISDEGFVLVKDVLAEVSDVSANMTEESITVSADIELTIFGKDSEGLMGVIERTVPAEFVIANKTGAVAMFDAETSVGKIEFSQADGGIEVSLTAGIYGLVYVGATSEVITGIAIAGEKEGVLSPAALTLYFAGKEETVWDIARKYNADPDDIAEENELEGEVIPSGAMVLIPCDR
jgi:LysM domain.